MNRPVQTSLGDGGVHEKGKIGHNVFYIKSKCRRIAYPFLSFTPFYLRSICTFLKTKRYKNYSKTFPKTLKEKQNKKKVHPIVLKLLYFR